MNAQLSFGYPRRGLEGQFATFRLGLAWATKVTPASVIDLVDSRSKKLLKTAAVEEVFQGTLKDLAAQHAHLAHNWRDHDPAERAQLLVASMMKRYPPGRVRLDSPCTVLYLRELPSETAP